MTVVDMTMFPRGVPGRSERSNIAPNATWLASDIVTSSDHWRYQTGKIFLGANENQILGFQDNRHLITVAGSRAGKGVSAIIPNLLLYPGSALVIDPKGENATITAKRRKAMGQEVHVLDPFQTSGESISSFNPLDMIDISSETCVDDAALIADALIIQATGDNQYFTAAARNWIRGLLLFIAHSEDDANKNLFRLRHYLTLDRDTLENDILPRMKESDAAFGVIARAAGALDQKGDKEFGSVLSTAIEQTDFLDSPAMRRVLMRSDFVLRDLKEKKLSIFLCLPAGRMSTHNRWLRIFINLVIESLERYPKAPEHPLLVIMDEFPILGHLESIEKASGLIAGFGVRLWPIIQDLSQLKRHYKESWETFMGNAGLLQAFGNADLTTLKYLSDRIGQSTVLTESKSEISQQQAMQGFTGKTSSNNVYPLMTSDEIARHFSRQSNRQLLLWPGANPIAADRIAYYNHPMFQNLYEERKQ